MTTGIPPIWFLGVAGLDVSTSFSFIKFRNVFPLLCKIYGISNIRLPSIYVRQRIGDGCDETRLKEET